MAQGKADALAGMAIAGTKNQDIILDDVHTAPSGQSENQQGSRIGAGGRGHPRDALADCCIALGKHP